MIDCRIEIYYASRAVFSLFKPHRHIFPLMKTPLPLQPPLQPHEFQRLLLPTSVLCVENPCRGLKDPRRYVRRRGRAVVVVVDKALALLQPAPHCRALYLPIARLIPLSGLEFASSLLYRFITWSNSHKAFKQRSLNRLEDEPLFSVKRDILNFLSANLRFPSGAKRRVGIKIRNAMFAVLVSSPLAPRTIISLILLILSIFSEQLLPLNLTEWQLRNGLWYNVKCIDHESQKKKKRSYASKKQAKKSRKMREIFDFVADDQSLASNIIGVHGVSSDPDEITSSHVLGSDMVVSYPAPQYFQLCKAVNDMDRPACLRHKVALRATSTTGMSWSCDAKKMIDLPNAGGTSVFSEALSLEILQRAFNAKLEKTEMEIEYWPHGSKITDYSCKLWNQVIGVSVTRAFKHNGYYDRDDAQKLLHKKLFGVLMSTQNVLKQHAWKKQILHAVCPSQDVADLMQEEFCKFPAKMIHNTVLLLSVCSNAEWIFKSNYKEECL